MEAIFKRRSVRRFQAKPVPEELITKLLQAGMRAPSAGNEQPWEFVVLQNRETMVSMLSFHEYAGMLKEAACAIVVCGDLKLQKFPHDFWVQDCSAAAQNMLLEAVHLGLGGVWLGIYPIEERVQGLQQLLDLPVQVLPLAVLALGYPAEQPKPLATYNPQRVHWEKW